ncbi:MAG: hypothetical protein ACRD41_05310 [Candidatus Acidiferrales bacterium]
MYETGGMRRVHLRGRNNILKRLLVHGAAFNLALVLRKILGVGKPRQLQGLDLQLLWLCGRLLSPLRAIASLLKTVPTTLPRKVTGLFSGLRPAGVELTIWKMATSTTGC